MKGESVKSVAVIGSGPTAFASLQILRTKSNIQITHFDAHLDEDSGTYQKKWSQKTNNGNNFAYVDFPYGPKLNQFNTSIPTSFAKGGLSNVWGATMLPYSQGDILEWPIDLSQLSFYYEWLEKTIPMSARNDGLSSVYPLYREHNSLEISHRVDKLLKTLEKRKLIGLYFGYSRLAVQTKTNVNGGCYYCNNCLRGCTDNYIWSAKNSIINSVTKSRVVKIHQVKSRWKLEFIDTFGNLRISELFDKVFICCGPTESFRILSKSGVVGSTVLLRDSSTFYIPLILKFGFGKPPQRSFALSQAFIRLEPIKGNLSPSHFQIYEYSPAIRDAVLNQSILARLIPKKILDAVLKRCFVAIGYLASDNSSMAEMSLLESGDVKVKELTDLMIESRRIARQHLKELSKHLFRAGIMTSRYSARFSPFGAGAHTGAWLRMGYESNKWGEPNGFRNVHVLDASILPSIPAGAITFTVMANAMRITDEVLD